MNRTIVPLAAFIIGLIGSILLVSLQVTHLLINQLERFGYLTAFIGGMLYTSSLTSAPATIVLAHVSEQLNPIFAAVIGAIGASLYDLVVFKVFNRSLQHRSFFNRLTRKLQHRKQLRRSSYVLGAVLIASPLPDELGVGLLDLSGMSQRWFIPLSFALNTFGILVIIGLF